MKYITRNQIRELIFSMTPVGVITEQTHYVAPSDDSGRSEGESVYRIGETGTPFRDSHVRKALWDFASFRAYDADDQRSPIEQNRLSRMSHDLLTRPDNFFDNLPKWSQSAALELFRRSESIAKEGR